MRVLLLVMLFSMVGSVGEGSDKNKNHGKTNCEEIEEVLLEAVDEGIISLKDAKEVAGRCYDK